MNYDFKAARERMIDRRREIIRQKDGKSVEGLPVLSEQKENSPTLSAKVKNLEKSE